MIFGAILASGKGERMRASIPKQFIEIHGKPLFIHTLEKFLLFKEIDSIIIAVPKDWIIHTKEVIKKYVLADKPIMIVEGGDSRTETIIKIIDYILSNFQISDEDIIITHDANRPFVSYRIIEENILAAKKYGAADTVIPATNTIVVSEDGQTITEIPDRRKMYEGQTPQTFRIKLLHESYLSLSKEVLETLTDAAKAVILSGHPVYMVEGDSFNIKLTTPEDLEFAKVLIRSERNGK